MIKDKLSKGLAKFPLWFLIMLIVMSGVGAAVGVVLQEKITAEIPITVGQALMVGKPEVCTPCGLPWPHRWFSSVSDDRTAFSAAVEAFQGEEFWIRVPLENRGMQDLVIELYLENSNSEGDGITLDCDGEGVIDDVVRIAEDAWKFTLDGGAWGAGGGDYLMIKVALGDYIEPGFYKLEGYLEPVEY